MAKYALVGGLNTGVDFAVFVALVYGFGMGSVWAQCAAYFAGMANSYYWNRKWTFRTKGKMNAPELVRFAVINAASFVAATAVLLTLEHWGAQPAIAKIASIVCSLIVNYAGYRLWVFRGMESAGKRAH